MTGETLGGEGYDPTRLAGNMRLTEAEIKIAAQFYGDPSSYDLDYAELAEGQEVTFRTEERENKASHRFVVTINNLVDGISPLEGKEDFNPPVKLFEATVLSTDREHIETGEGVFGLIFPEGFAVLVDSAPESDFTNSIIQAGLVLAEAGYPYL